MKKPYLVLINGILAACHLTRLGALKQIQQLASKGITAVIAYKFEGRS